ncbi:phage tail assembly protein [Herbaspirillum camelliae]|uniref:phage tail assembly protein n=1 Tax=Herbaspirillum camelliae TaxID=1892903 RepID=UPI00094A100B|nr:phage tail assembly protein [Herbaspirillum camelliae]
MSYDQLYPELASETAPAVQTPAQVPSPTLPPPVAAPVGDGAAPLPLDGLKVDAVTYQLKVPILAEDGFEIKTLKLRRLKGREMKGLNPSPAEGRVGLQLQMIAAMNGLPHEVLDELDAVDVIALLGESAPFLVGVTGATPSA